MDKRYKKYKGYYNNGGTVNTLLPPYLQGLQRDLNGRPFLQPQVQPSVQTQGTPYDPASALIYSDQPAYIGTEAASNLTMPKQQVSQTVSQFQFTQPYTGYDLPTSTYMLGQNIEQGDALGIASTGLKTAMSLGKNILSGMGQARTQQANQLSYWENIRDYVSGADRTQMLEEGGTVGEEDQVNQLLEQVAIALQESSPEEVIQLLIAEGMPEDQANEIVSSVAQVNMKYGGTFKSK